MVDLRDRVARELHNLLRRAGLDNPWSDRAGASTRWLHSDGVLYEAARVRLHRELVEQQRATSAPALSGRLAVVITAGVPGAGKSSAIAADPRLAAFRDIDADDFKDPLLLDAEAAGLLAAWTGTTLADGRPVALRELSGFVHAESTAVADAMRQACFADGENVVIHGTLASVQYLDDLLGELDDYGYDDIIVYDVEVSAGQAVEQALARWWACRTDDAERLGGRFVPPAAIRGYYPAGSSRSITAANAQMLAHRAEEMGWSVDLRVVDAVARAT